jgi:ABC-type uncharacterized transport system YnjBCD permease subunit
MKSVSEQTVQEFLRKGASCPPFLIALVLSVANLFMTKKTKVAEALMGSVVQLLILFVLCYYGYEKAAWVFLLLPLIIIIPELLIAFGIVIGHRTKN